MVIYLSIHRKAERQRSMKESLGFTSFPVQDMGCRTVNLAAENDPVGSAHAMMGKSKLVLPGEEEHAILDVQTCLALTAQL